MLKCRANRHFDIYGPAEESNVYYSWRLITDFLTIRIHGHVSNITNMLWSLPGDDPKSDRWIHVIKAPKIIVDSSDR